MRAPGTFIFCFGSNHPGSFAKIFSMEIPEFLSKCISAGLPGYGRVFAGSFPSWSNGSAANIFKHPKSEVEGYAIKLSPEQVQKLDLTIGVQNKMYNRIKV